MRIFLILLLLSTSAFSATLEQKVAAEIAEDKYRSCTSSNENRTHLRNAAEACFAGVEKSNTPIKQFQSDPDCFSLRILFGRVSGSNTKAEGTILQARRLQYEEGEAWLKSYDKLKSFMRTQFKPEQCVR